jgi:hypothetical protein
MATRKFPSYAVEIVEQGYRGDPFVLTLYTEQLSPAEQTWWCTKHVPEPVSSSDATTSGVAISSLDRS